MQNINHGKYINYLILWCNSEIDAAEAQKTERGRERGEREIRRKGRLCLWRPQQITWCFEKRDEDGECVCVCVCVCQLRASNGYSDPFGLCVDSAGQLALDEVKTTDDRVEILNASEELNIKVGLQKYKTGKKMNVVWERSVRGERVQKKREMSGGGGIERCVSPVLDCFSLIALH